MKRTNIFFPKVLLDRLGALSKLTGLSVAEHVRRAVDAYLKKQK
jgi:predicted DNA-binding protein